MSTTTLQQQMDKVFASSSGLTKTQQEQRDRFIERALAKLDEDDFKGFWDRMDVVNAYVRRIKV